MGNISIFQTTRQTREKTNSSLKLVRRVLSNEYKQAHDLEHLISRNQFVFSISVRSDLSLRVHWRVLVLRIFFSFGNASENEEEGGRSGTQDGNNNAVGGVNFAESSVTRLGDAEELRDAAVIACSFANFETKAAPPASRRQKARAARQAK